MIHPLQTFLEQAAASGELTAVTALVGTAEGVAWSGAAGLARRPDRAAGLETRYDLASVTKPFAATLALVLDQAGRLPLGLPVGEVFPEAARALAPRPLEDLLRHRAGVAAWAPLYRLCRSLGDVLPLLLGGELPGTPAGTYSDLDFLLWGLAAERRLGQPLDRLLATEVLAPLELAEVVPCPGDRPEVAESLLDTGMEVELARGLGIPVDAPGPPPPGRPQDGNARFLTSLGLPLPAHSGLFGRAADLYRLGLEWLRPGRLLKPEAVQAALSGDGPFALGWWRRAETGGGGPALSPRSFGHTGFAGANLWIDPDAGRILAVAAHRTDPFSALNSWRRRFNALAYDCWAEPPA